MKNKTFLVLSFLGLLVLTGLFQAQAQETATAAALQARIASPPNNISVDVGESVNFSASATGGQPPYAFTWDFGDGTEAFGQTYVKSYSSPGAKTVTLRATDFSGAHDSASVTVNAVTPVTPLTVSITAPINNATVRVDESIIFTAAATGGQPPYAFTWDFGDGTEGIGQNFNKIYSTVGEKNVKLKVTDFAGRKEFAVIKVIVITAPIGPGPDTASPSAPIILQASIPLDTSTTTTSFTVSWSASIDPEVAGQTRSGLAGYSYLIDQQAVGVPDKVVETMSTNLATMISVGSWWLHLVAVDKAENVSTPVTHYGPVVIVSSTTTPPDSLVISNIRVTDITHNDAVIRWTTNRPASSRVIYDTVSHSNITGESAPNFGYASSSATFDTEPKLTEHAVTVTDLAPSTTYYFRVISQE